jgi:hypothetical protein
VRCGIIVFDVGGCRGRKRKEFALRPNNATLDIVLKLTTKLCDSVPIQCQYSANMDSIGGVGFAYIFAHFAGDSYSGNTVYNIYKRHISGGYFGLDGT